MRIMGTLAVAVVGLALLAGCGDDGEDGTTTIATDVKESICRLIGDTDCDGTIDADADGDGIFDLIDRYPGGYDYGDDDEDGYANWADLQPLSPRVTIEVPVTSATAVELNVERELEDQAAELARSNEAMQVVLDQMDEEAERLEGANQDSDYLPDFYDPQPTLHASGDEDDDGSYNHEDLFPYSPDYE